jgi:hypothetical protein
MEGFINLSLGRYYIKEVSVNIHENMVRITYFIMFLLFSLVCYGQREHYGSQSRYDEDRGIKTPSEIYREVVRSTVTVITEKGLGSGFFVTPNVIATNYHVVEGANSAYCIPDNSDDEEYQVTGYMALDEETDLILLRVAGVTRRPLQLASGSVVTGQIIYAIGTPQGMDGTISDGIVSAVRNVGNIKLLQITAPISQGSSGGPVVNRLGQVVGVSTLMHREGQNLNFAVSFQHLAALMQEMSDRPRALSRLNRDGYSRGNYTYDDGYGNNNRNREQGRKGSNQSSSSNNAPQQTLESFRRDYNYIAIYDPGEKEWSNWQEGTNTVVFNINNNGDIRIYYASGKREVFRKVSNVVKDQTNNGEEFQMIAILDESGNEQLLQLFDNGDMKIIFFNGVMIQFTNEQ